MWNKFGIAIALLLLASEARGQNEILNSGFTIQFVDSQEQGYEARLAIDNDPTTMWATNWIASHPPFPHEIVINMGGASFLMYGLGYLARQDGIPNGNVGDYEISLSQDGINFTVITKGTFVNTMQLQMAVFPIPTYAKYVKLKGLTPVPESPVPTDAMVAAEIKLYKFNGSNFAVRPGEPFYAAAYHDGQCTVGYRLYANDVVIGTLPVSSLANGQIQFLTSLKLLGFYQIKISAYTMDMCGITADEKFSESVVMSVENILTTPGLPTLSKQPYSPTSPSPDIPPVTSPATAQPAGAQPKPRVIQIPPARK